MKSQGKWAVLTLAMAGALSMAAWAQTTDEGPGPSEQPSAPMEVGQDQGQQPSGPARTEEELSAQPTEAQPGGPSGEAPAQTDQGVARVSLIHGDVSTQRGDSGDWSAAALNQPVMGGDKISTGDNARAELQLDFANTLRLGPNSKANVANLTHKNIQIQLGQGILTYSVSKDSEAEPEIDSPNVAVHPSHHDGVFRIEVQPDGDTIVIVRQGEAQIATPQGSTEIHAGEMATVRGDINSAQYKIGDAPNRDDWDRWNADRDHMIRDANSWRHTNRRYTGTQDLDAYGRWQNVPDYGDVWVPNEPEDWAPYRNGNWVYEPYYGWTWVGYEPWGWAPYHYGRWFWYGNSWAWWPGPVWAGYNPFWAPAYVSFWGWGGGFGFGVGFGFGGWGGFGWLPLGPCDWFHPWWGGYAGRFGWVGHGGWGGYRGWGGRYGGFAPLHSGLRYSNIANLHDSHIGRGLSTVGAGRFGAGRVGAMAATREQIGGARMMAGNLPVVPTHASLSASGRAAAPSTMHGGSQNFYGSHNNMARPASFQQQTAGLRQSMQQSHVGGVPAGGRSAADFSARARSNMQRPSAGTPAARESGSFNRGAGNTSGFNQNRGGFNPPASGQNRGGFNPPNAANGNRTANSVPGGTRSFAPPANGTMRSNDYGNSRMGTQSAGMENRGGFRPFTPPSNSQASRGESNAYGPRGGNSSGGNYWNRTAPSSPAARGNSGYGGYSNGMGRGSSYGGARPQLDMRQPIARSPNGGAYSRGGYGNYGGSRAAPSYGGSRSAPSYGGGYSSPGYGGGRAPSYGGGGHAPSYGGGGHAPSYGGGGGGHAPSGGGGGGHAGGGGGGHSGGGGGGGHSGGGGHR